ncbi:MAG: cysteine--tRNA ligase [Pseudomonadota bacterium]
MGRPQIKLYNSLSRSKVDFEPIDPENVRMYVCGPTVYDYAHIGNARPVIVFDVLFRLLRRHFGPDHVTYARNITDVDDKINARANEEYPELAINEAIAEVTTRTEQQFHADIHELGVLPPTVEPRATGHIEQMRRLIDTLIDKGHAYVGENHVLFDVESMPQYGRLANRSVDEMEAGARVDVAPYKKGAMDFVLWKPSSETEPAWPSPGGIDVPGRPGWHIECSAMAEEHLGRVFDIHGGGVDLVFPHHENELAQSCCAHGTERMANIWMHNGFLQVEGEKMSKSLGNFITINELLETTNFGGRRWPGEVLRLAMLTTHYRQPIDFTSNALQVAEKTLANWYNAVGDTDAAADHSATDEVDQALCDDLNTPAAIARLHSVYDQIRTNPSTEAAAQFKSLANQLGILNGTQTSWASDLNRGIEIDEATVQSLIDARLVARSEKDWALSDKIRDQLSDMGVQLKDGRDPESGEGITTWEIKR